jgi:hypothetical protein
MKRLSLTKAVEFYLQQRRQLGFLLKEEGQMLHQLVRYASAQGHRGPLTTQLALSWAQAPEDTDRLWWARRLDAARRLPVSESFDRAPTAPRRGSWGLLTVDEPFAIRHGKNAI